MLSSDVAYPLSDLNDVRIDLRPNVTASGQEVAYITDSSQQCTNGLIIVDLGTHEARHHLDGSPSVKASQQQYKEVWGESVYFKPGPGQPYTYDPTGADGIGFLDGADTIVGAPTGSRYLYAIANQYLLDRSPNGELAAQTNVRNLGEKGTAMVSCKQQISTSMPATSSRTRSISTTHIIRASARMCVALG